ncbi:MAG: glycosyltransferase family 2 protein [Acidobacteria bacterium]|nr:glycosyltransferase family 2 protein [Acidobacteriota bacterium]MDW7983177.1 glycosyltransferase family 2 protein [Acidobacteriota bacterium]
MRGSGEALSKTLTPKNLAPNPENSVMPKISVVIPFYNEETNVAPVLNELLEVLDGLRARRGWTFEVLCVDDGSSDGTLAEVLAFVRRRPEVRALQFGVNYGQTAALSAGFHQARGEWVVTMDGDGQNDPQDIPRLLDMMEQSDYDVISGWRKDRKDPWLTRRLPSRVANALISHITGVRLRDYGCTLKVYRRELLQDLHLYGEMHRFIPALARWLGARIAEVPVRHRPRTRGTSKYGLSRVFRVLLDLLVVKFLLHYSTRPIHFFGTVGIGVAVLGWIALAWVVALKLWDPVTYRINRNPLLYVGLTFEMIACQLILMGLLGEMLVRIYHETQRKPIYRIKYLYAHAGTLGDDRLVQGVSVDPHAVGADGPGPGPL